MAEWKKKAEQLRFEQSLSWTQVASALSDEFPELDKQQVLEKVRTYLRTTKRYKQQSINKTKNKQFFYTFDKDLHMYIIGDAHCGASTFMKKDFIKYINKIAADENAVVFIVGDLIENATRNSKSCVYRQTMSPQKQKETIVELLKPIKDKILSVNWGNHCERTYIQAGSDIMYDVCVGLGILDKYSPVYSHTTIKVGKATYKIYSTHNLGKSEAALRKMAKSFSDVDILIGGHIHTPKHLTVAQKQSNGKQRDIEVIICNAWLYDEDYAISASYEPVSIKAIKARIHKDNKEIEVIS